MKEFEFLRYVNARGESIAFGVGSIYHVNVQKDVSGISDITNTIYSTGSMGQNGDTYVGNRIEPRDVELNGKIKETSKDTYLKLRRDMVRILNPELEGTLYYFYGNYVKKIGAKVKETPRFTHPKLTEEFSIVFRCLDPFWRDEAEIREDIASWIGDWEFPCEIDRDDDEDMIFGHHEESVVVTVYNGGHVDTGMRIQFRALGAVVNPSLFNVDTREYIKINYTMQGGDIVTIDTNYGNKGITLLRNGVETNLYRYMDVDSTFMQLTIGDNTFRYDADGGLSNLEATVFFAQKYLGV